MTFTDHEVMSGEVRICARDYGGTRGSGGVPRSDGPDVLLIHGGGRNIHDWDEVVSRLDGMRVVAMDMRGHGASDIVEEWSWDAAIADVGAVIGALGMQHPVVVGHSMGGMLACAYAAQAGGVCPGSINVDGSGQTLPSRWPGLDRDEALARFERLKERGAAESGAEPDGQTPDEAEAALASVLEWGRTLAIPDAMLEAGARRGSQVGSDGRVRGNPTVQRMAKYMVPIGELDMFDVYRRIYHPLLLILATGREKQPEDWMQEWMDAFNAGMELDYEDLVNEQLNVRIERMDGSHMLNLEVPDQVAASITRFVREVS